VKHKPGRPKLPKGEAKGKIDAGSRTEGVSPLQLDPSVATRNAVQGHKEKRCGLRGLGYGRRPLLFPCESR